MTSEEAGRRIVYARSLRRCEVCGREAHSVHHRVKKGQGGRWDPENLLDVCGDGTQYCHGWIERNPTHALALGLWVPAGTDPAAVPVYARPTQFHRDWWWMDRDGLWTWCAERAMHPEPPANVRAAIAALTAERLPALPRGPLAGIFGNR